MIHSETRYHNRVPVAYLMCSMTTNWRAISLRATIQACHDDQRVRKGSWPNSREILDGAGQGLSD